MSFNVASSSGATSNLTVEQVKAWSQDDVKKFLQKNKNRLDLEDEEINKIYTQRVKGSTFLDFTAVDFERWGVPGSPAKEIEKLINEIKGVDEHPMKKRRIERGWKSYTASDGHSVELPPQIIDMLESDKFVPESRNNFTTAFQNLNVGQPIVLPHLGQKPKHFARSYQGRTLFVTQQMIDLWVYILTTSLNLIKIILSGPMGVGKSYISYFLACKAYAEGWIVLYIADAADLNVGTSAKAAEVICRYFLALNKDILTAAELKNIVKHADNPKVELEVTVADEILDLLKNSETRKSLLIVDEHGALFEEDPVPKRLPVLNPFMNLNYWGEHFKWARVIFTGTAHAKYERVYVKNGHKQEVMIFVGPLQSDVFDKLLQLHQFLREPSIKEEVKRVTNCVPRELVHLAKYIDSNQITTVTRLRQALKVFEDERVDEILHLAQNYFNSLRKNEQNRYYNSLTSMFLPNKPTVQFGWKFLDLGLVYRYNEGAITHYLPLCPSARKALLKMYTSFELPENIKYQLNIGNLSGNDFEEALFTRLASRCNTTIQLNSTDINNNNSNFVTLQFDDYDIIKTGRLSLGPGFDKVLARGFDQYPRFDYMLGTIFIQVSVSDFVTHNQRSTDIKKAFEVMSPQANITQEQISGRNQIEMYLDEMYGSGHSAKIHPKTKKFIVTRNNEIVTGFRIVYIRGSDGIPNHSKKVNEFPDVAHVTFKEITDQLFKNIDM